VGQFESLWRSAVRYRQVTRDLEPRVRAVHRDLLERSPALKADLEKLLAFLASERGRTDANCCAVDFFFSQCQSAWSDLPPALRDIFDDMSGTLHDAIYAPKISANFGSLPEQLLERVREVR
jgi:hypothetical protein